MLNRFLQPHRLAPRQAWTSIGAPIVGLVVTVVVLAFALVTGFARQQDQAFAENSQRLVQNATRERVRALQNITIDFAVWNDAYAATNGAINTRWLQTNYYSNIADSLIVLTADGQVHYDWASDAPRAERAEITTAISQLAQSSDLEALATRAESDRLATTNHYALIGGQIAIVSFAPINLERQSRVRMAQTSHFLAAVDVLTNSELTALGATLRLQTLTFARGDMAEPGAVALTVADGPTTLGALNWRRERPGSAAFLTQLWPIVACLLLIGALTLVVTHMLVGAYVRAKVRADSAQETSRLKSEFIATMSYELRTPLNAIVGYAELIQEEAESLGKEGRTIEQDANHVLDAAKQLGRLVNNILDQSRIDAGRLQMASEAIGVAEILTELNELMIPLAQKNENALRVNADDNAGAVRADPVRLQQCLVNLTNNALKFTRAGSVSVIATRRDEMVRFEVRDTGVGMGEAEIERLFRPFPVAHERGVSGSTGLSLSVTRSLARAMGGDVTAQSTLGQGSTFTLILPSADAARKAAA